MERIFLNHTNHPFDKWGSLQKQAAEKYGRVVDMPFPQIPALMSEEDIELLASQNAEIISAMNPAAVLCQGEFCYTIALTGLLKKRNIHVLCACSERCSKENLLPDGSVKKFIEFRFVKFRHY